MRLITLNVSFSSKNGVTLHRTSKLWPQHPQKNELKVIFQFCNGCDVDILLKIHHNNGTECT
jgi:hypothetical protein